MMVLRIRLETSGTTTPKTFDPGCCVRTQPL
jgi:hypothetical protein